MSATDMSKEEAQWLLLRGVLKRDLTKIDKALAAGVDINHRYAHVSDGREYYSDEDVSPIYIALRLHDRSDLPVELLKRGANPLQRVCAGRTSPMHQAVNRDAYDFIAAVAALGYRLQDLSPPDPNLIFATREYFKTNVVKALVAAGADVNVYDSEKTTPLYNILSLDKAESEGRYKVYATYIPDYIRAFLDAGADIYARTPEGKPLYENINPRFLYILTEHFDTLHERLACEYGAGMEPQRLVKDGKPTPELLQYCGADMAHELFTEYRWHGKEAQALAVFDEARAALPECYKSRMDNFDLSPLRRAATCKENASAVKRYIRPGSKEVAR